MSVPEITLLRQRFEARWTSIGKRSNWYELTLPPKEELWALLLRAYHNGFKCEYCGTPLKIVDSYPYRNVFSFEHKKSLYVGGDNNLDNMAVICHKCNIVKGTVSEDIWRDMVKTLPKPLFDKFCEEHFAASMAATLERQGKSKKRQRPEKKQEADPLADAYNRETYAKITEWKKTDSFKESQRKYDKYGCITFGEYDPNHCHCVESPTKELCKSLTKAGVSSTNEA